MAMVLFDFIKDIFGSKYIAPRTKGKIVLEEEQTQQKITIIVDDIIKDIEVYKFANSDGEIDFPFFKQGNVNDVNDNPPSLLRKFCDYIVICTYRQKFYVILVELKAFENRCKGHYSAAKEQLDAGEVFIKYIFDTFERIKNHKDNKANFSGIEQYVLDSENNALKKIVKKVVFLSNINQSSTTKKDVSEDKVHSDGYYRCDLDLVDKFQLRSIFQKNIAEKKKKN